MRADKIKQTLKNSYYEQQNTNFVQLMEKLVRVLDFNYCSINFMYDVFDIGQDFILLSH